MVCPDLAETVNVALDNMSFDMGKLLNISVDKREKQKHFVDKIDQYPDAPCMEYLHLP